MKWTKEDDYKRRNVSFKNMANGTAEDKSLEEHSTIWSTVFVTEFILISIINTFTITAFARNRHLRKRSTYLIINLTVADLLVGAVTGPVRTYEMEPGEGFSWRETVYFNGSLHISSIVSC